MPDISTAVLSYLETLSRKDLIELIHSFANAYEDIRFTLEEKSGMENAKNKNDAVTVYGLQFGNCVSYRSGNYKMSRHIPTQNIGVLDLCSTGFYPIAPTIEEPPIFFHTSRMPKFSVLETLPLL